MGGAVRDAPGGVVDEARSASTVPTGLRGFRALVPGTTLRSVPG
jgi:hypothetical protein